MIYLATDDLRKFYNKFGELQSEGIKPRWFSLCDVYFICDDKLLQKIIFQFKH